MNAQPHFDPRTYSPQHFKWHLDQRVGVVTLNRPDRKNPLTFDSYAELRDLFRALAAADPVRALVITGAGGNFCSGGDVHEIIGPLTQRTPEGLLEFTRMTGEVVKAMRACPQPIVAAVDGEVYSRDYKKQLKKLKRKHAKHKTKGLSKRYSG